MKQTKKLTTMAIMTALSVILVALLHLPIFPAVPFLEYDLADVPILICGFAFGPWAGLAVTAVAAFIQGFTVSAESGIYGILMHLLATGAFVCVAAGLYQHHNTKKGAAASLLCGALAMILVMFGANLVVTPYFLLGAVNSRTLSEVLALMPWILAFNAVKAGVNGAITFLIYKRISNLLRRFEVK